MSAAKAKRNIKQILAELATLYQSRDAATLQLETQLAPHKKRLVDAQAAYCKSAAPLEQKFHESNQSLFDRINALEKQAVAEMLSTSDAGGILEIALVENAGLICEATTAQGKREVNVQQFFAAVPPNKRDSKFWDCVSILVTKAEKLLGERINEISARKRVNTVTIRPKQS